jgi:hypothetical protein
MKGNDHKSGEKIKKILLPRDDQQRRMDKTLSSLQKKEFLELKKEQSEVMEIRPRLLVYGWIACVLETFFSLSVVLRSAVLGQGTPDLADCIRMEGKGYDDQAHIMKIEDIRTKNDMEKIERQLMIFISRLYTLISNLGIQQEDGGAILPKRQSDYMRKWLEEQLPLLFCPLFVPAASEVEAKKHYRDLMPLLMPKENGKKGLPYCWSMNAPFIQAKLDNELLGQLTEIGPESKKKPEPEAVEIIDIIQKIPLSDLFGMPAPELDTAADKDSG